MNKVDLHIKQMMLQHPSIFPNRISCLKQLFLTNGNGYEWDNNNCLTLYSVYEQRPLDKMYYDDLDNKDPDSIMNSKLVTESDLGKFHALCKEKELINRQFREKNIDLLCQFHDFGDEFSYKDLMHFDINYSAFRDAPYGKIDKDWLSVMEETVTKIKYAFNIIYSLHYDNPIRGEKKPEPSMFSRMPDHWQKLYTNILEIDDKLEAQSGTKARAKEYWESIKHEVLG